MFQLSHIIGRVTSMAGDEYWNTDHEKSYINLLISGAYTDNPQLTSEERLSNYIKSAKKRIRWKTFGNVNGYECIEYAEQLLGRR